MTLDGTQGISKLLVTIAGMLLATVACIYVAYTLFHTGALEQVNLEDVGSRILILAPVYLFCTIILGVAWHSLIAALDRPHIPVFDSVGIYALTQINKYIPSNVVHLIGRYAVARRYNVPSSVVLKSMAAEAALILCCALALAAMHIPASASLLSRLKDIGVLAVSFAGLATISLVAYAFLCRGLRLPAWLREKWQRLLTGTTIATALYIIFYLLCGLIILGLIESTDSPRQISLVVATANVALAWALGFAVPGVSAGVGVREGILILTLSPEIGESEATIVALSYRVVTLLGDFLGFLVGIGWWLLERRRLEICHLTETKPPEAE
ncbi:MAG: hypothetical protein ACREXS_19760 [Gammaproteobacteria bacterium]